MEKKFNNLSNATSKVLNSLVEVLLPTNIEIKDDLKERIIVEADDFLNYFPVLFKIGLIAGIYLFNFLAFFTCFKPFTWCSYDERMEYYKKWADSPIFLFRTMVKGLKVLIYMEFYNDRDMWELLGYFPEQWHNERVDDEFKIPEVKKEVG